ncbi:hypothetical protein CMV14_06040 [Rhizorhabdus dicambivorans]|nr:hypothetical protein CMV14_06040 [Rhizorhabdus dicambivorans]
MAEIAKQLRRAYDGARPGEKLLAVHLFVIENAERLRHLNIESFVNEAGLKPSYRFEVHKALNLAYYVKVIAKPGPHTISVTSSG